MADEYRHAPISCAWVALNPEVNERPKLDKAYRILCKDPAWAQWMFEHISRIEDNPDAPLHYLNVDHRRNRRIVVKGEDVHFYEPVSAVIEAKENDELLPYFIRLLEALYTRFAEKTGRPAPPRISA